MANQTRAGRATAAAHPMVTLGRKTGDIGRLTLTPKKREYVAIGEGDSTVFVGIDNDLSGRTCLRIFADRGVKIDREYADSDGRKWPLEDRRIR